MSRPVASNGRFPPGKPESVIPFAPAAKTETADIADRLDVAGQNVLALLHQAAEVSEEDYNHAVDVAQKLSHQLRDAEERIKSLDAEVRHYRDRADRAEKWLSQIAAAIEQKFFGKPDNAPAPTPRTGPRML
jgi:septal ring factor EnvC (AmiA/AmiB activator)